MKNNLRIIIALACLTAVVGAVTGCSSKGAATDTGDKSAVAGKQMSAADVAAMNAGIARTQAAQAANQAKLANQAPGGAPGASTAGH